MAWLARGRGGNSRARRAEQFDIAMFGEEPAGNYNRILLSNVLNGSNSEEEIFLNPLSWYAEHNIRLHVGKRASGLLAQGKTCLCRGWPAEPYDKLIIATAAARLSRRWKAPLCQMAA